MPSAPIVCPAQYTKVEGAIQTSFMLKTRVKNKSISQAATNVWAPVFIRKDVISAIDKGTYCIVTRRKERQIGVCAIQSRSADVMQEINAYA